MTDSKNGSKSNLNESNMPLLSEEAAEKGGDTPEKEVIEMTETEKVTTLLNRSVQSFFFTSRKTLKITMVPQILDRVPWTLFGTTD